MEITIGYRILQVNLFAFRKFPDIFRSDINILSPNQRSIVNSHSVKESNVIQLAPIGLIQIARTVKNSTFAGVEYHGDLVTLQGLSRNYIVQLFH